MIRALLAVLCALLFAAPAAAQTTPLTPEPPLTDADYFAFTDRVSAEMDRYWLEGQGYYRSGASSIDTILSAAMLTVHATAAAHGHAGPARNDTRARRLVRALTSSPPYFTAAAPPHFDKMFHTPGWTSNMQGEYVDMDKSIDPKVAEGLQIAYRARGVLNLGADEAARIRNQIHAVAGTEFFRYPKVRLNQINWHAELYAYDQLVNDDPALLRGDYRAHVHDFTQGFKRPQIRGGSTNVGPSYRFHYQNNSVPQLSRNVDSAEYANMTLHFIYWYDLARAVGMVPLPAEDMRLLRAWTQRALYGYWTHAGFMNWDTGWSFERWMKGKAWAYGMQGLLAIATSPSFQLRRDESAWAKYLFDRGLRLYEHLSYQVGARAPFRPSAMLFHIGSQQTPASTMFWARMAANASRAVSSGMGRMNAKAPPPTYAYDADVGRLAVSTPRYSTAILAVPRKTIPYGGIELARFYDADGDPIGGTGARAPATFGMLAIDRRGRRIFASQTGFKSDPKRPPLTLTHSPRGRVTRQRRLAARPDAGPFTDPLSVTGARTRNGITVRNSYAFRRNSIRATWTLRRPKAKRHVQPLVTFPTWGKRYRFEAVMTDGQVVRVANGTRLPLASIRSFHLRGEYGAYRVDIPAGTQGETRFYKRRRERANPRGGATLALALPRIKRGTRHLSVTIVPDAAGGLGEAPQPYGLPVDE